MKDDQYHQVVSVEVDFAVNQLSFLSGIMMAMESDMVVDFDHHEINALGHILNNLKQDLEAVNWEWRSYGDDVLPLPDTGDQQKFRLRILADKIWTRGNADEVNETIKMLESQMVGIRLRKREEEDKERGDKMTKGSDKQERR